MVRGHMPDHDGENAQGRPRRRRRSREEVSRALVDAASRLFAERPSGRVTVREIAARADVNPALVHRYFDSKENLMRAAIEQSQRAIAANLPRITDVRHDATLLYRATMSEREFVAVLARASLDGVLPDFPPGYPTMGGLVRRIEADLGSGPAGRHDPRVVVACLSSLALGYSLFGEFVRRGTGLDDLPDEKLDAGIQEVLLEIVGLAYPEKTT